MLSSISPVRQCQSLRQSLLLRLVVGIFGAVAISSMRRLHQINEMRLCVFARLDEIDEANAIGVDL
jgi:hypothetical protein